MGKELDPITYEILRNRLWKINEEVGTNVENTTTSYVVFEARDFNSAIMNAEGDSLVIGPYFSFFASVISATVECILKRFKDNPGINDGDMFLTNDTYSGACHSNDGVGVSPIFWDGEIICWVGVTIHEEDVGGPIPGSFCMWAKNLYEEAPYFPPIKIVDGGTLRKDLVDAWKFNSRLPWVLDGNLRARLAGINAAKERIYATIERYGVDALALTFERMADDTEKLFRERLLDLPDGTWRTVSYPEHSAEKFYPIKLAMTKKHDRLIWDFTGTAAGTDTPYNLAIHATRGGIESAVLPFLCWDIPWTLAGIWRCMEVVTEPGSQVDARPPMATNASIMTLCEFPNILAEPLSRMLSCSEKFRDRAMAAWGMLSHGTIWDGRDQYGEPFTTIHSFLVEAGGGGAWACRDGEATDGYLASSTGVIANIEVLEAHIPALHLFWRAFPDSGGAGKFRGGPGPEAAFFLHDVDSVRDIGLLSNPNVPLGYGIEGGYPGGTHRDIIIRGFNIKQVLKKGKTFAGQKELLEEVRRQGLNFEIGAMTYEGVFNPGDVKILIGGGGCGYGDPLERDPEAVLRDVKDGLVTIDCSRDIYGVEINLERLEIDWKMTDSKRKAMRESRLK